MMKLGQELKDIITNLAMNQVLDSNRLNWLAQQLDKIEFYTGSQKRVVENHTMHRSNPHLVKVDQLHNGLNDGGNLLGVNLIKNYPSLEGADGTAPLWWTPANCTVTEEDATGESLNGTQTNERIIKCVTTASSGGIYQDFVPANERLLVADETVISFGVWVYMVTAGTVTLVLNDTTDGNLAVATVTETGKWVRVEFTGITLGAGTIRPLILHSANPGTFYLANPVLNVGSSVIPWKSRGLTYRHVEGLGYFVSSFDPAGTAWTEHDLTSLTSNNAVMAELAAIYRNQTTGFTQLSTRHGSSSSGHTTGNSVVRAWVAGDYYFNTFIQLLDDRQVFDYGSGRPAGENEFIWFSLRGYWEWE